MDEELRPQLINIFKDPTVLNIFCDASVLNYSNGTYDSCAGSIVVCNDTIIDSMYRICKGGTNCYSEAKAVLMGIYMAIKYRNQFPIINIFSDSQITIFGIRDRYITWPCYNNLLYTKSGGPVINQELFIEMVRMINQYQLHINFWHQKGHVNRNIFSSVQNAADVFRKSNHLKWGDALVDYQFIRYISEYNEIVDNESRRMLKHINDRSYQEINTISPFMFTAIDNGKQIQNYKQNMTNNKLWSINTKGDTNYEK